MPRSPLGAERAIKRWKSEVREVEANTQRFPLSIYASRLAAAPLGGFAPSLHVGNPRNHAFLENHPTLITLDQRMGAGHLSGPEGPGENSNLIGGAYLQRGSVTTWCQRGTCRCERRVGMGSFDPDPRAGVCCHEETMTVINHQSAVPSAAAPPVHSTWEQSPRRRLAPGPRCRARGDAPGRESRGGSAHTRGSRRAVASS